MEFTKKQLDEKLTPKQKIFCHEYIVDWNGAKAARTAGYAKDSARQGAIAILSNGYINQYIDFIKNDLAAEAKISKLGIIKELKQIAFSDITKLYDSWYKLRDFQDLQFEHPELMSCIQEITTRETKFGTEVKIKMYDRRGALQDVLKAMGWNEPDKMALTLANQIKGITFDSDDLS